MSWYFLTQRKAGHVLAYGPFSTKKEAQRTAYFVRPPYEATDPQRWSEVFEVGVESYGDSEIAFAVNEPRELGFLTFRVSKSRPPVHTEWQMWYQNYRAQGGNKTMEEVFNADLNRYLKW